MLIFFLVHVKTNRSKIKLIVNRWLNFSKILFESHRQIETSSDDLGILLVLLSLFYADLSRSFIISCIYLFFCCSDQEFCPVVTKLCCFHYDCVVLHCTWVQQFLVIIIFMIHSFMVCLQDQKSTFSNHIA